MLLFDSKSISAYMYVQTYFSPNSREQSITAQQDMLVIDQQLRHVLEDLLPLGDMLGGRQTQYVKLPSLYYVLYAGGQLVQATLENLKLGKLVRD